MKNLIPLEFAPSWIPVLPLVAVVVYGFLCVTGSIKTSRAVTLPFLALLALVLFLAWLVASI